MILHPYPSRTGTYTSGGMVKICLKIDRFMSRHLWPDYLGYRIQVKAGAVPRSASTSRLWTSHKFGKSFWDIGLFTSPWRVRFSEPLSVSGFGLFGFVVLLIIYFWIILKKEASAGRSFREFIYNNEGLNHINSLPHSPPHLPQSKNFRCKYL